MISRYTVRYHAPWGACRLWVRHDTDIDTTRCLQRLPAAARVFLDSHIRALGVLRIEDYQSRKYSVPSDGDEYDMDNAG